MLFFIPLYDYYAPVVLPYFGPFMIILDACMLFVLCRLDLCSFFVMLAKSQTLSSAVSINVMLIPFHVFSRQTVSCGLACGVLAYTLHHTPRNTWEREKRQKNTGMYQPIPEHGIKTGGRALKRLLRITTDHIADGRAGLRYTKQIPLRARPVVFEKGRRSNSVAERHLLPLVHARTKDRKQPLHKSGGRLDQGSLFRQSVPRRELKPVVMSERPKQSIQLSKMFLNILNLLLVCIISPV